MEEHAKLYLVFWIGFHCSEKREVFEMFKMMCSIIWIRKLELKQQTSNFFFLVLSQTSHSLAFFGFIFTYSFWGEVFLYFPGCPLTPISYTCYPKDCFSWSHSWSGPTESRFRFSAYRLHFSSHWTVSCRIGTMLDKGLCTVSWLDIGGQLWSKAGNIISFIL